MNYYSKWKSLNEECKIIVSKKLRCLCNTEYGGCINSFSKYLDCDEVQTKEIVGFNE